LHFAGGVAASAGTKWFTSLKKERKMMTLSKRRVAIYVDKTSQQWIVRDPDGKFWIVPMIEAAWENRTPFTPDDACELEPVPAHYQYMLGLPF
jgi:hypothetical protein